MKEYAAPAAAAGEGVLTAIGMDVVEERAYLALLDRPNAELYEVAAAVGAGRPEARRALARLQGLGLVMRSNDASPRFAPVSPELALEPLILRQQEILNRARVAASQLENRFRSAAERLSTVDLVEILADREVIAQRVLQMERMATSEVLHFSQPPYAFAPSDTEEGEGLQPGVHYRTIYDAAALDHPGVMDELGAIEAAGGECRTHPSLPFKMLMVDRRFGLIPLSLGPWDQEGALFVHASTILDALLIIWDTLWSRATPTPRSGPPAVQGRQELSEENRRLATLLLGGLKGSAIARQLGVSATSVERRVKRLMELLDSSNRFQAGYMLAKRALLDELGTGGMDAHSSEADLGVEGGVSGFTT